jgi:hypothetical protein
MNISFILSVSFLFCLSTEPIYSPLPKDWYVSLILASICSGGHSHLFLMIVTFSKLAIMAKAYSASSIKTVGPSSLISLCLLSICFGKLRQSCMTKSLNLVRELYSTKELNLMWLIVSILPYIYRKPGLVKASL